MVAEFSEGIKKSHIIKINTTFAEMQQEICLNVKNLVKTIF